MGEFIFLLVFLPLMLIAPIYAELKVNKEEALEDVSASTKADRY